VSRIFEPRDRLNVAHDGIFASDGLGFPSGGCA
jgi:hypothetical protein